MGFVFEKQNNKQPEPTTVTIPIEEYEELKQAVTFIEDQGYTKKFMMYCGLFNDNLASEDSDDIFIEVD